MTAKKLAPPLSFAATKQGNFREALVSAKQTKAFFLTLGAKSMEFSV